MSLLTGGNGCLIPIMAIPWKGLINFLHQWMSLLLQVYLIMCGINMFRLRFLYLLGVFFATVFRQRIILWGAMSFNMTLTIVSEGVVVRSQSSLFLHCATFGNLWVFVSQWLHVTFVSPEVLRDHLLQFGHLAGLPRFTYSFLKLIWHACVWVIWKKINNHVFNQQASTLHQLTDKVKQLSFHWLKACPETFSFSYHDWWKHPLLYMRVFTVILLFSSGCYYFFSQFLTLC